MSSLSSALGLDGVGCGAALATCTIGTVMEGLDIDENGIDAMVTELRLSSARHWSSHCRSTWRRDADSPAASDAARPRYRAFESPWTIFGLMPAIVVSPARSSLSKQHRKFREKRGNTEEEPGKNLTNLVQTLCSKSVGALCWKN